MNKKILLVLTGILLTGTSAWAGNELNFNVITFNIINAAAGDEKMPWDSRRESVMHELTKLEYDFIGIQGNSSRQHNDILAGVPGIARADDKSKPQYDGSIYYKTSVWEVVSY